MKKETPFSVVLKILPPTIVAGGAIWLATNWEFITQSLKINGGLDGALNQPTSTQYATVSPTQEMYPTSPPKSSPTPFDTATSPPPTKDVPRGTPPPPPFTPPEASHVATVTPTILEATKIPTEIPEAPKSFITPRGKELPLGSHLDEFGNGDMYVTSFLAYDPCPDVAKIDDPMLYDPKYEKGGVEFMCFWDDVFNGGAWVDGRRLVYPPKQP